MVLMRSIDRFFPRADCFLCLPIRSKLKGQFDREAPKISIDWWTIAVSAICAGVLMPLAICARSIGRDAPGVGRKVHDVPTSRLGGVIVFVAFVTALVLALRIGHVPLSAALPLALAAIPVVLVGLLEDLTRNVRPRYRMAAAVVSAVLASAFSGGIDPAARPAAARRPVASTCGSCCRSRGSWWPARATR